MEKWAERRRLMEKASRRDKDLEKVAALLCEGVKQRAGKQERD